MKLGNSKKKFISRFLMVAFIMTVMLPQSKLVFATSDIKQAEESLTKQVERVTSTSEKSDSLPSPEINLKNKVDKNDVTYFYLEVTNYKSFPNSMFAGSRTNVEIYDAETNKSINRFVSLTRASNLNRIWFKCALNKTPPKSVYIKFTDRREKKIYKSNTIVVSEELLNPVLRLKNTEEMNGFTYYNLEVTNHNSYPNSMFEVSSELPENSTTSRTSVEIYDGETNEYVHAFTSFTDVLYLKRIWFAVPTGATPNKSVYIKLVDHKTNKTYKSNTIIVVEELPNPVLRLKNTEEMNGLTYFNLEVENYQSYPDSMFVTSPDLPRIGNNISASRTWIEIYNGENNAYIYGFANLSQASDLNGIWFSSFIGQTLPKSVYIKLVDRKTKNTYKSNILVLK